MRVGFLSRVMMVTMISNVAKMSNNKILGMYRTDRMPAVNVKNENVVETIVITISGRIRDVCWYVPNSKISRNAAVAPQMKVVVAVTDSGADSHIHRVAETAATAQAMPLVSTSKMKMESRPRKDWPVVVGRERRRRPNSHSSPAAREEAVKIPLSFCSLILVVFVHERIRHSRMRMAASKPTPAHCKKMTQAV